MKSKSNFSCATNGGGGVMVPRAQLANRVLALREESNLQNAVVCEERLFLWLGKKFSFDRNVV